MRKTEYTVDLASEQDMLYVLRNLRSADRDEILGMYGREANVGVLVRYSWRVSRDTSFVGKADGEPLCLFGVTVPSLLSGVAAPWMLGTDALLNHSIRFLRASRAIVSLWAEEFPVLRNHVDQRNEHAVRWLQWLGFRVYSPEPYGPDDLPFHLFEMRGPKCVDQQHLP